MSGGVIIEKIEDLQIKLDISKIKASNNFCHGEITAAFFEEALEEADILYKISIKTKHGTNLRGFSMINTHDSNGDELSEWYINLICISKYDGLTLRSGLNSKHKIAGRDLINAIIQDANQKGKDVKLKAVDNVIGYYFKLGFKLALPNGSEMKRFDYEMIKILSGLQRKKTKTNSNLAKINSILKNPRLTSAVEYYWSVLSTDGKEAADKLIENGYTMVYQQSTPEKIKKSRKSNKKKSRKSSKKNSRKSSKRKSRKSRKSSKKKSRK